MTEETTLAEDVAAAFDAVEEHPDGAGATAERLDAVSKTEEPVEGGADDQPDAGPPPAEAEDAPVPEPTEAEAQPPVEDKGSAPIGWDAGAKKSWNELPPEVRTAITSREQQMAQAMEHTSHARRAQAYLHNLNNQYGALLAAEGVKTPMEAIDNMFGVISQLRMGGAPQKAQIIAQMIQAYGVDIEALDNVLSGDPQYSAEQQKNQQVEQLIDQKMQPVNQLMQQQQYQQQQYQQQQQQSAYSHVGEFAKKAEFIEHVRNDMADLIDLATSRNQQLDLGTAYQRACAMNPQVQQILRQRQQQSLQEKQKASQSVSGTGAPAPVDNSTRSLHDDISAAWDALMQ